MQKILFKTSLKCNGCVNAIKPGMDSIQDVHSWNVLLDTDNKVLEVEADNDVTEQVLESVKKAGYEISRL